MRPEWEGRYKVISIDQDDISDPFQAVAPDQAPFLFLLPIFRDRHYGTGG
jgi:hypothetical protein